MTGWIHRPVLDTVPALTEVALETRAALRDGPADPATFRAAHDSLPALGQIEKGPPMPVQSGASGALRVVAWNVERLRHLQATADLLLQDGADVSLITEIDKGMARTGNTHRTAELSAALGQPYAYATEFVELDLGTEGERADHACQSNALGFHGNAVLSRLALHRPVLFRLEAEGHWFGWTRGEPRVGGRIAVGGQVMLDGVAVTVVGLHLESHSDPAHRAGQMARLVELIAQYDPTAPVLIGGDVNTSTRSWAERVTGRQAGLPEDPLRRCDVVPHEPLFAVMAAHGFDLTDCNVQLAPTQRFADPAAMAAQGRAAGKIDWIFTRGLTASDPAVIPAVGPDGAILSDHDAVAVTIRLLGA
jgi:endonuclease/exonuclease/phosphatase family metal-dependent hydrolase